MHLQEQARPADTGVEEAEMNKTSIEWVKNPDGTQGYTWNPITGCLNGCEYCYARKLANTRLRERYLANDNIADPFATGTRDEIEEEAMEKLSDPFYPRFWNERLWDLPIEEYAKPRGIFVCDMSDLFGKGIPEEWTKKVFARMWWGKQHRYYLLTKQPQNLIKWSPFPENCWVGVSVTEDDDAEFPQALACLLKITATVKFISFEPLLGEIRWDMPALAKYSGLSWVIIGAQTSPKKMPEWAWVKEIIDACDKAGVAIFLKNNLGLPRLNAEGATPFYKGIASGTMELRQELPK